MTGHLLLFWDLGVNFPMRIYFSLIFSFQKNSDTVQMAPVNEMGASNGEDQMNNVQKNGGPIAKPSKLGGWFWSSTSSTDGSNSMGQASSETVQQQHERALNALERQYNVTAKEKRDCMVIGEIFWLFGVKLVKNLKRKRRTL